LLKRLEERQLDDARINAAIADLNSPDHGKRGDAARRLANAGPHDRRRADVVEALCTALSQEDEGFQRDVLNVLRTWGDRTAAPALIDRIRDKSFRQGRDALELLVRIDPSQSAAEAVVARMADDYGLAGRLLREIGASAVRSVADAFQHAPDLRTRVEAARILGDIGTGASLPMLQEIAAQTAEGALAREADEALKAIRERG
jgi:HEAT repeat protein